MQLAIAALRRNLCASSGLGFLRIALNPCLQDLFQAVQPLPFALSFAPKFLHLDLMLLGQRRFVTIHVVLRMESKFSLKARPKQCVNTAKKRSRHAQPVIFLVSS